MKIQWLGTAASEGWPALFCQCEACRRAMKMGGKNVRTRSGALIDDRLLIELNPDLYAQKLMLGLDLGNVTDILVTHHHSDHFQPDMLEFLGGVFAHRDDPKPVHVYGPANVIERCEKYADRIVPHALEAGDEFEASGYRVTVLPAIHGTTDGKFYLICRDDKSILYAHDTDMFCPEAMEILRRSVKKPISLVSMDCTNGPLEHTYAGHMGIAEDAQMKEILIAQGMADQNTRFVCNHFSHNGRLLYEEMSAAAAVYGMEVSYDGMTAEV